MAYDKVIDSSALDAGMTATANAIRKKTGGTSPIAWDSANGFKAAVEVISMGSGVELPELGDTAAQPTDIVAGKTLYDDEGNPVTGTLVEADEIQEKLFATSDYSFGGTPGGTVFSVAGKYNANIDGVVVRRGAGLGIRNAPTEFFGNATADQVAKGATFTSAAGLLMEGTHECEGGVELPELGDIAAKPTDMVLGKVLYDDEGNPVTGTLYEANEIQEKLFATSDYSFGGTPGGTVFHVSGMYNGNLEGVVVRPGAGLGVRSAPTEFFGNAAASNVAKGKTFTSAAGLLVEGTREDTEKDVNFYDYDGTLLYAYTLEEAQALTELPPAPTPKKEFLVFDEWNWTLEQIKSLNLPIDVGAIYKTVDEKTYLVIEVTDPAKTEVTLNYCQWCSSIKVNWGDGSVEEETTQSSGTNVTKKHTYDNLGRYTITINANGTWNAGLNSATGPLIGVGDDSLSGAFLREVYTGKGIRMLSYAFSKSCNLETITLSKQVTFNENWTRFFIHCYMLKAVIYPSNCSAIYGYCMDYCYSLSVLSLPYNMTKASSFNACMVKKFTAGPNLKAFSFDTSHHLKKVWISEGVERLLENCFRGCTALETIVLPASLQNIANQGFTDCFGLMRLRFQSTTPPTVVNANAFTGISTSCIVEVPAESLEAYKNATNYGTIAAQMVGV